MTARPRRVWTPLFLLLIAVCRLGAQETAPKVGQFVLVEGGSYLQGDPRGDGAPDEYPRHVSVLGSFYLSFYEITFGQYDPFAQETGRPRPGDYGWGRAEQPAINVSWFDAAAYCNWLSLREGYRAFYEIAGTTVNMDWSADGYRLPTEAEWEYAARGGALAAGQGTTGAVVGWHSGNSGGKTHATGGLAPNALGLYDMAGNVWEWCNDWYGAYTAQEATDPKGPDRGDRRVLRGGSWYDTTYGLRPTARSRQLPTLRLPIIGFRVARPAT